MANLESIFKDVSTFRVVVRVRPFLQKEVEYESENLCIRINPHDPQMIIADDKPFVFDHVYDSVSQMELYKSLVFPLVSRFLEGFHCTIMAYGHTGTGKTHTMGSNIQMTLDDSSGILPRALDDIFARAPLKSETYKISVSGIEVYNDKVYDLIADTDKPFKVARMASASTHVVHNREEALTLFKKGSLSRHTRGTKLNPQSSRSHAIFTIHCSITLSDVQTNSCLHLVDLAGSESVRTTGHEGMALVEGIKINQCLLGLHLLLRNLARNEISVSYRESLLTTLLQDAINANNYVVLLGCISPSILHVKGTLTTLEFVSESKCCRSKPQIQATYDVFKKDCEEKEEGNSVTKKQFLIPEIPQRRPFKTPGSAQIRKFPKTFLGSGTTTPSKSARVIGKMGAGNNTPRTPRINSTYSTPQRPPIRIMKMNATDTDFCKKRALPIIFDKSNDDITFNGDLARFSTSTVIEKSSDSPLVKKFEDRINGLLHRLELLEKSNLENQIGNENTLKGVELSTNTHTTNNEIFEVDKQLKNNLNEKQSTPRRLSLRKQVLASETRNNAAISPAQFPLSPKFKVPDYATTNLLAKDTNSNIRRSLRYSNKIEIEPNDELITERKTPKTSELERSTYKTPPEIESVRRSIRIQSIRADRTKPMDTPIQSAIPNGKPGYMETVIKKSTVKRKATKNNEKSYSHNFFFQLKMGGDGQPVVDVVNPTNMEEPFANFVDNSNLKSTRKETRTFSSPTSCHARIQKLVLHILNTASTKDLQVLETIGPVTAEHIYNYREAHGKFKSLKQLRKVPFWSEKLYFRFLTANNM